MTIHLGCTLPHTSCNQPGQRSGEHEPACLCKARLPPLFGLAPGGVCRAASVAGRAVRSYRTLSPLPLPVSGHEAVCFLWHFPWSRLRRTLSGTVSPWSPDFPHNAPDPGRIRGIARSSSQLVSGIALEHVSLRWKRLMESNQFTRPGGSRGAMLLYRARDATTPMDGFDPQIRIILGCPTKNDEPDRIQPDRIQRVDRLYGFG